MKNSNSKKKWRASNGNVCFRLPIRKTFERPWIIISVIFLVVAVCSVGFFVWDSYTLLVLLMIILFFFFIWWAFIPARQDDTFISKNVHEIMDKAVDKDAQAAGAKIVKRMVNHDTKGTYGIIEASCFIVLLDNDEVWEYPLIYHNPDKQGAYFECERNHIVSENQKHIRKINPKRWKRFTDSLKLSEKTYLGLLLATIFIIGGLVFVGFCLFLVWVIINHMWHHIPIVVITYVLFYSLIKWLYSKYPNKFLNVIRNIISAPFAILYLLVYATSPFITIAGTYLCVAGVAFGIPAFILKLLSLLGWFVLKPETIIFVVFIFGSIMCSNSRITEWIIRHSILKDCGNHSYETYREKLAIYLIHPSNVIFLLYLIYFMFLGVSGFLQIEYERHLISQEFDTAMLKAFLLFIAYTNMRTKSKEALLNTKELFQQTMKLFVHDK